LTETLVTISSRSEGTAKHITYLEALSVAKIQLLRVAKILQTIGQRGIRSSSLDDATMAIEQLQRAVREIPVPPPAP
jgi:hypothetical protein